jgi:hypothetical protein
LQGDSKKFQFADNKTRATVQLMLMTALPVLTFSALAQEEESQPRAPTHMSQSLRSSFSKVVVLPSTSPASQGMSGSYATPTAGLLGGAMKGRQLGDGISKDIGGIRVGFPIRILTQPGMLLGGLLGMTKRQIQDFRDRLTVDLARATGKPLSNDKLASDVFWSLRRIPDLDSKVFDLDTPIPKDTDAILYVSLTEVTISIDGKEAVITTTANSTLRRISDGAHVFEKIVQYEDRDTLSNWTKNDSALWRDYANFARHYIGREIAAEVFDRVELQHQLSPEKNRSVKYIKKNPWQGISKTLMPTLAWQLTLTGGDSYGAWVNEIDIERIEYDVEVYDMHRRIYVAKNVQGSEHVVEAGLEACKSYRWSVRPSYKQGGQTRFGEWMRSSNGTPAERGNVGRKVSAAPAYLQDFASLKIKCGSK